jgi:glutaminase
VIDKILTAVYESVLPEHAGKNADYIPALAAVDPELFGLAIVTAGGDVYTAGDADVSFTIQSLSKPFALAWALNECGPDAVFDKVGTEPSGDPFNSVTLNADGRPPNPMVNSGAIAVAGMLAAKHGEKVHAETHKAFSRFAGSELGFDDDVYASEADTDHRNQAIAHLLYGSGVITEDPAAVVDSYTRQCSQTVTATQLATMAATLANIGKNPITGDAILDPLTVRHTLSLMFTCGMYDGSGDWAVHVGLPAKSGVSGGVMAVVNRQIGIGLYSPRLDQHGNSVRAIRACEALVEELGLHAFEFSNAGSSMLGVYL